MEQAAVGERRGSRESLALRQAARTVTRMRVLTSTTTAAGHLVVMRLPATSAVVLRYTDGDRQDITEWAADLLLIGMVDAREQQRGEQLAPAETVELAHVVLEVTDSMEQPSFTYLHLPSGDWVDFGADDALRLIGGGVRVQVTAGTAHEATQRDGVPDDASGAATPGAAED